MAVGRTGGCKKVVARQVRWLFAGLAHSDGMAGTEGVDHIGVVGTETRGAVDALAAAGGAPETGDARTVLDAGVDLVVAVGEAALAALAREAVDVPVLPVDAGRGVRSVPADDLWTVADRLTGGDWSLDRHPLVGVSLDGERLDTALLDVMLVTSAPADISEFAVRTDEPVAQFRADGVVVATPAGTTGYAAAAGAAVSPPGPSVLSVEPVAPFATRLGHWVLPPTVTVSVEREEAAVELQVDDRTHGPVRPGAPVELAHVGWLRTVRVPEGVSPFRGEVERL
jgi:NAD+ kinase